MGFEIFDSCFESIIAGIRFMAKGFTDSESKANPPQSPFAKGEALKPYLAKGLLGLLFSHVTKCLF